MYSVREALNANACGPALSAQVASKAEAEYIFSTAHKYKGGEEDYVQLADDFIAMADGIRITVVIDEYNLVYVAVTRAQRALIMNADVSRLVLEEAVKPLFLRVSSVMAAAAARNVSLQKRVPFSRVDQCPVP